MRRLIFLLLFVVFPQCLTPLASNVGGELEISPCRMVYDDMGIAGVVSYAAFEKAYSGWQKIECRKKNIMTLIDFTRPSTEERLYVLDLKKQEVLYVSHVSHGRNSGENYATSFSNKSGSHQSSLGFYITGNTYQGRNGYSLLLDGLEKGINDKARERAIVIHGADYANPAYIGTNGRLGRSFGCPALPVAVNKQIIDTIKDGTVLFIYANDKNYLAQSAMIPRPIAAL